MANAEETFDLSQGGVTAIVQDSDYDLTHADATKGRSDSLVPSDTCRARPMCWHLRLCLFGL